MYIHFSESFIYRVPQWLFEESLYLKYDYTFEKKYQINEITKNLLFHQKELWGLFYQDEPYLHFPKLIEYPHFYSLFRFLQLKKEIGFYIKPNKYNQSLMWLESYLFGFQKFGMSEDKYKYDTFPISIIYETIKKNDTEWLKWGLKYIDYRDYDVFLDDYSFQLIYEYKAFDCIPVILEFVDTFTDYLKEKYQIDILNEFDAEEVTEKIRDHQIQIDILHLGKKIKKLKMK
jgi:hypothetical protein